MAEFILRDDRYTVTITGTCVKCTECCRHMITSPEMLTVATLASISLATVNSAGCKYLVDGLCSIQVLEEADLSTADVPTEAFAYYEKNCRNFPGILVDQQDRIEMLLAYLKRIGWPSVNCGYVMKVVETVK